MTDPILDLLNRKVGEVEAALAADLERELLWGGSFSASQRFTPRQQNKTLTMTGLSILMENTYKPAIASQIFKSNVLLDYMEKEKPMSVTSEIRAATNRAKEVKRVTRALKRFEGSWLYKLKAGAHIGFNVTFDGNDTKYIYAGLFDGKRWHLTGARSPQGISTDDLVDWLIDHKVSFGSVKLYKAMR